MNTYSFSSQFSVSSLTTTTSAESSVSAGLISSSWPLANGAHCQLYSNRSSQSLGSPPSPNLDEQSQTIIKEILTYPWTNEMAHPSLNQPEIDPDQLDHARSSSVVADQFQPDFYYLCPLKNTVSFLKTDEKANGIHRQLSHDVWNPISLSSSLRFQFISLISSSLLCLFCESLLLLLKARYRYKYIFFLLLLLLLVSFFVLLSH